MIAICNLFYQLPQKVNREAGRKCCNLLLSAKRTPLCLWKLTERSCIPRRGELLHRGAETTGILKMLALFLHSAKGVPLPCMEGTELIWFWRILALFLNPNEGVPSMCRGELNSFGRQLL